MAVMTVKLTKLAATHWTSRKIERLVKVPPFPRDQLLSNLQAEQK